MLAVRKKFIISEHAVDRYIERKYPSLTRGEAMTLLEKELTQVQICPRKKRAKLLGLKSYKERSRRGDVVVFWFYEGYIFVSKQVAVATYNLLTVIKTI